MTYMQALQAFGIMIVVAYVIGICLRCYQERAPWHLWILAIFSYIVSFLMVIFVPIITLFSLIRESNFAFKKRVLIGLLALPVGYFVTFVSFNSAMEVFLWNNVPKIKSLLEAKRIKASQPSVEIPIPDIKIQLDLTPIVDVTMNALSLVDTKLRKQLLRHV